MQLASIVRNWILLPLCMLIFSTLSADEVSAVKPSIVTEVNVAAPGETFWGAVHLEVEPGWMTYWQNPGEVGVAPAIQWHVPKGATLGELSWPTPHKKIVDGIVSYGMEGDVWLLVPITLASDFSEKSLVIEADLDWVVCSKEECVPGDQKLKIEIPVGTPAQPSPDRDKILEAKARLPQESQSLDVKKEKDQSFLVSLPANTSPHHVEFYPDTAGMIDDSKLESEIVMEDDSAYLRLTSLNAEPKEPVKGLLKISDPSGEFKVLQVEIPIHEVKNEGTATALEEYSLGFVIVLAFLGGLFLNLMPCVLPVVSLKILNFMQMAGQSRFKTILHGSSFSLGVIVSFWVLASILLVLRASGSLVGWGFQLQEPAFVAVLAAILLLSALNLFGVFEFGLSLSSKAGEASERAKKEGGLGASFLSGVLATAVATPCSGPFLGTALGIAVTLPALYSLLVFTFLGLGMAFPYLLLAFFPKALKILPKPGAWMETFKQSMGFLMLLTVLWLVWVFAAQVSSPDLLKLFFGLFLLSFAAWLFKIIGQKKRGAIISLSIMLVGLSLGLYSGIQGGQSTEIAMNEGWEAFSPEKVNEIRGSGKPVFVDFTAKWCLLCQSNHFVLESGSVKKHMEDMGVVRMKADWTKKDAVITKALEKFGRNSVPLYIYYPAGLEEEPVILSQVLTPQEILQTIKK